LKRAGHDDHLGPVDADGVDGASHKGFALSGVVAREDEGGAGNLGGELVSRGLSGHFLILRLLCGGGGYRVGRRHGVVVFAARRCSKAAGKDGGRHPQTGFFHHLNGFHSLWGYFIRYTPQKHSFFFNLPHFGENFLK